FEATFGDSDKTRTAANKIRDLDWGETALIDQFRTGLREDVKDLLLTMPDPTSLNDAIAKAVRYDNRLFERRQERRFDSGISWNQFSVPTTNQTQVSEPMQIDFARPKPLSEEEKR
ncbi:3513_t:CDS:2, partial [Dentiscutata heterogama]